MIVTEIDGGDGGVAGKGIDYFFGALRANIVIAEVDSVLWHMSLEVKGDV